MVGHKRWSYRDTLAFVGFTARGSQILAATTIGATAAVATTGGAATAITTSIGTATTVTTAGGAAAVIEDITVRTITATRSS